MNLHTACSHFSCSPFGTLCCRAPRKAMWGLTMASDSMWDMKPVELCTWSIQPTWGLCHLFTQGVFSAHTQGCLERRFFSQRHSRHLTMIFLPIIVSSDQESIPFIGVIELFYISHIPPQVLLTSKPGLLLLPSSGRINSFPVSWAAFFMGKDISHWTMDKRPKKCKEI